MKLKELIIYLNTAQEKLGLDAEVVIGKTWDGEEMEIEDVVMKAEQSLLDTTDFEDSKVIIKF